MLSPVAVGAWMVSELPESTPMMVLEPRVIVPT